MPGPVNGSRPVASSKAITPRAYTSVRASMGPSSHCSGAMYSGVPMMTPDSVRPAARAPRSFAIPKSTSFTKSRCPWRCTRKTFSGFRSRWITPCSWAHCSASHSWSRTSRESAGSIGPPRILSASVSPSRYSIT